MIRVREIRPIKLSGRSSLYVTFDFNQEIINILKGFQPAVFHKKLAAWEISSVYLAELLDSLTRLDDIELTLLTEDETKEVSCDLTDEEIKEFKYKPFEHQIEGINFLLKKKKALLLDSMGVGKSLTLMYMAETLHERKEISHCLIICGVDSLRSNWKSEILKFSKKSVLVLGEKITKTGKTVYDTIQNRVKQLLNPIDEFFVVVNVATLRDQKVIDALMNGPNKFEMIAVDEIHKCLTKDTIIETDAGKMRIDELMALKKFPKILSYNYKTKENEFCELLDISKSEPNEPLIELEIINDFGKITTIKCTESHKIYTDNRGWVKAKNLTSNDDIKVFRKVLKQV